MDYLKGMNDCKLKPRLLHSLMRDRLPDEKRPFPDPMQLSSALSLVKAHGLLSEDGGHGPLSKKVVDAWKSSVDDWVERALNLAASKMPDKCWAGICLLGVTCGECSSDRFLASYANWFQKLLAHIQPLSESHFIRVASCSSLSDFFTRLAEFSTVKKDATSLAMKVVQPVLQLLNEDSAETVWVAAVDFLCVLINLFPASVYRHNDRVEFVIVSRIMSGKYSVNMSQKLASCLAMLPKGRGDEESWSVMVRKILIAINIHLNGAFQGFEEGNISSEVMKLLIPPGKEPPPPLGGNMALEEESRHAANRLQELLVPRVSTFMRCCAQMLTNPYPVQVAVPIYPLLKVVERVLLVDGSLCESLLPLVTSLHQEILCSELPALHLQSLDLLIAIIRGMRSQLLPHAAGVARLLTKCFRRGPLPSVKTKLYAIVQNLLISSGVGMALYLAQEVINNAFVDLTSSSYGICPSYADSLKVETEALLQTKPRKRKHSDEMTVKHQNGTEIEVKADYKKPVAPTSVRIAALQALEALLTTGGSLRSDSWRTDVDLLLISVATSACDATYDERGVIPAEEPALSHADYQLAALQALLASFLSQTNTRPPYLSLGLELFRKGKQETGTRLATFCAHALLTLEVLIHPRILPLADLPADSSNYAGGFGNHFSDHRPLGNQNLGMHQFARGSAGVINGFHMDNNDDDFYPSQIDKEEDLGMNVRNGGKKIESAEQQPSRILTGEPLQDETTTIINPEVQHETMELTQDLNGDVNMVPENKDETATKMNNEDSQPDIDSSGVLDASFVTTHSKDDEIVSTEPSGFGRNADFSKQNMVPGNETSYDSDESSLGSIPDIVDVEPDSESDDSD